MEMPNKLKVVLALSAVSVVFDVFAQKWLSAVIGGLIIFALFKGHEAARTFVLWCSAIGFVLLAVVGVFALLAFPVVLVTAGPFVAIGALMSIGFGLVRCGLTVWVLREHDVQQWMYSKSMGDIDSPNSF